MNLDTCKEGQRLTITTSTAPHGRRQRRLRKDLHLTGRIAYRLLAGEAPGGLQSIDSARQYSP
ncbi:MAG: hypothetical protein ACLSGS_05355 [Adlercreutzia sp.]